MVLKQLIQKVVNGQWILWFLTGIRVAGNCGMCKPCCPSSDPPGQELEVEPPVRMWSPEKLRTWPNTIINLSDAFILFYSFWFSLDFEDLSTMKRAAVCPLGVPPSRCPHCFSKEMLITGCEPLTLPVGLANVCASYFWRFCCSSACAHECKDLVSLGEVTLIKPQNFFFFIFVYSSTFSFCD